MWIKLEGEEMKVSKQFVEQRGMKKERLTDEYG